MKTVQAKIVAGVPKGRGVHCLLALQWRPLAGKPKLGGIAK